MNLKNIMKNSTIRTIPNNKECVGNQAFKHLQKICESVERAITKMRGNCNGIPGKGRVI